jgi:hypothetical protein
MLDLIFMLSSVEPMSVASAKQAAALDFPGDSGALDGSDPGNPGNGTVGLPWTRDLRRGVDDRILSVAMNHLVRSHRPAFPSWKLLARRMAETEGFEPSVGSYPYGGLANRWFQPLTHVSGKAFRARPI